MESKPKLAIYWSSGCGGCEIAFANLHERLLSLVQRADLVFCPCLVDAKRQDVEAMADGELALTLLDGAIRTEENEEWAHLLRRKSRTLVAMGACAHGGGIPALANLHGRDALLERVFRDGTENPLSVVPEREVRVPEGVLALPGLHVRVRPVAEVVDVDYAIPGCPPESDHLWNVLALFVSGAPLPPRGAVLGATASSACAECGRKRSNKRVQGFRRTWELEPDPEQCLLEQGIVCMGPATRGGCGARCPSVQMPCIGCYGPPEGVYDQSAKMVSTLGAILDIAPIRGLRDEAEIADRVDASLDAIPDIAGVAGKFYPARSAGRRS